MLRNDRPVWCEMPSKSQTEAAKTFLEQVNHALRTEQIVEYLEKGGLTVGGNTKQKKITNLYTILHRSDDFAIVSGKRRSWGLVGWPGVRKKEAGRITGLLKTKVKRKSR